MELLNSFLGQGMVAQIGEIVLFLTPQQRQCQHDGEET